MIRRVADRPLLFPDSLSATQRTKVIIYPCRTQNPHVKPMNGNKRCSSHVNISSVQYINIHASIVRRCGNLAGALKNNQRSLDIWHSFIFQRNMHDPGPCITNVIATCRKNFSQWESSFLWKLRCHWLKFLRRVAKTLVIQGPATAHLAWYQQTIRSSILVLSFAKISKDNLKYLIQSATLLPCVCGFESLVSSNCEKESAKKRNRVYFMINVFWISMLKRLCQFMSYRLITKWDCRYLISVPKEM